VKPRLSTNMLFRFLLVSLVMDAVLADATIHQRRKTLDKMTTGFGLDDAYHATLDRIREQKGNRGKLGMEALMWILSCERQLKAGELCHALGVELGTTDINIHNVPSIRTLLSCTLGLVTIDGPESTVRLVHFTLQEYLVARHNLFITPHSMMAEICLTYLNFQSVCELSTALGTLPSTMPFLHYASCYWGLHAKKEMGKNVECLALQLLQQDANHIWVDILLREEKVGFFSRLNLLHGRTPDIRGFTGLHAVAYMGIPQVGIPMIGMKRWDLNGRDSNGLTPLMWAAKHGNSTLANQLLKQPDVDHTLADKGGLTPFIHASRGGHENVVKLFLEDGDVNPDSPDWSGRTPLSHAAGSGHKAVLLRLPTWLGLAPLPQAVGHRYERVVELLLQRRNVNPDSSDENGRTPLSYAAEYGSEGVVKLLIERGDADPDSLDEDGRTPLSHAAENDREGVVRLLFQRGDVNPNLPDKANMTPLLYATHSHNADVVRLLLERVDVGPNSPDRDGIRVLLHAAEFRNEGAVKLLWERVDVDRVCCGHEALVLAVRSGCKDLVETLLERGYLDPDWSDVIGRTQLSYAAEAGCERLVKLLLERGNVTPDMPDVNGQTPLSYAAGIGREQIVKLLLERRDVNPDSSDANGRTPLSHAAEYGSEGVVKLLLDRGDVNPDLPDVNGRTPISHAVRWRTENIVDLLLDRGDVNPNLPDQNGQTPLSLAAQHGWERIVKQLLECKDVDSDLPDRNGLTPLSYATRSNYFGTMRLLSNPRLSSHGISESNDVAHENSVTAQSAQQQAGLTSVSQQESGIPGHMIAVVIPFPHSHEPPSNQREALPSSPPLCDPSHESTILKCLRPRKRPGEDRSLRGHPKRKRFPSS